MTNINKLSLIFMALFCSFNVQSSQEIAKLNAEIAQRKNKAEKRYNELSARMTPEQMKQLKAALEERFKDKPAPEGSIPDLKNKKQLLENSK